MELTEIQKKLNRVSCPMCNHPTLDVTLRCYVGYEECLATAKCLTCGTSYTITNEQRVLEDGKGVLGSSVCPRCDAKEVELQFRCELASRQCFYVVGCKKCGESFFPAGSNPSFL